MQAIMHSASEQDVITMSFMSLGWVNNTPMTISPAGKEKIMSLPQVCDARCKCDDALDVLTSKFCSVWAAQNDSNVKYTLYKEVCNTFSHLTQSLTWKKYQQEYGEFIYTNQMLEMDAASLQEDETLDSGDFNNFNVAVLNPDSLALDENQSPDLIINSLLLVQDRFDNMFDALNLSVMNEDGGETVEDDSTCSDNQHPVTDEADKSTSTVTTAEASTCLHSLYRFWAKQCLAEEAYYESQIFRAHHFDIMFKQATTTLTLMSNLEISNLLLLFFKTMHPLECYGSLEPSPSIFVCSICQKNQSEKKSFKEHLCKCQHLAAQEITERAWKQALDVKMMIPCDWILKTRQPCGKVFTNYAKFTHHVLQHSWNSAWELCRYEECGMTNTVQLTSRDKWSNHLATTHRLTYYTLSTLHFYCFFCNSYIQLGIAGPSAQVSHYITHLHEAMDAVKKFEYNEVWSTINGIKLLSVHHPWFCIWCFHDPNLEADKRIATCNEAIGKIYGGVQQAHLLDHFLSLQELSLNVCCPASAAAGTDFPLCAFINTYTAERTQPTSAEWAQDLFCRRTINDSFKAEADQIAGQGKDSSRCRKCCKQCWRQRRFKWWIRVYKESQSWHAWKEIHQYPMNRLVAAYILLNYIFR